MDETEYLLASPANAERLRASIEELEALPRPLRREEEQSWWLHLAVAGKLVATPEDVMARASAELRALRKKGEGDALATRCLDRWHEVMSGGLPAVLDALTSQTAAAIELRQVSPFVAAVTQSERWRVRNAFYETRVRATAETPNAPG